MWIPFIIVTHSRGTDIYVYFNAWLSTGHEANDNDKDFETILESQLCRFNTYGAGSSPDSLLALRLLSIN